MKPYHFAWLSAHSHRTEDWLKEKMADGFDVHHIDGNHDNNDPDNLILLEHTDHMALHAGRTLGRLRPLARNANSRKAGDAQLRREIMFGKKISEWRALGFSMKSIGRTLRKAPRTCERYLKVYNEHRGTSDYQHSDQPEKVSL